MEITLREPFNSKFREAINNPLYKHIRIVSTDKEDKGKFFKIPFTDITSIDKDIEGLMIWWRQWSPLEGKWVTMSNHFKEYEFTY